MNIFYDTNIWVAFSFLIFAYIIWSRGKPAVTNMLDNRIETIRKDIEVAENLRVEAQELLAQYQRKHRNAVEESHEIVARAEKRAKEITKQAEKEFKEAMKRREQQLEQRLNMMKQNAMRELQDYAANLAIEATREIIVEKMDKTTQGHLLDHSVSSIQKFAANS